MLFDLANHKRPASARLVASTAVAAVPLLFFFFPFTVLRRIDRSVPVRPTVPLQHVFLCKTVTVLLPLLFNEYIRCTRAALRD